MIRCAPPNRAEPRLGTPNATRRANGKHPRRRDYSPFDIDLELFL